LAQDRGWEGERWNAWAWLDRIPAAAPHARGAPRCEPSTSHKTPIDDLVDGIEAERFLIFTPDADLQSYTARANDYNHRGDLKGA
jgi:hypothetical protein